MENSYPYIKKYLGEELLKREIEPLKNGEWLSPERKKEPEWKKEIYTEIGYSFFKIINELIKKNESVINFKKWAKEAKESKDLKDCLFELICIDEFSKHNKIIIKQKRDNKVPDAFIESEKIYLEMTNLENIPQSIRLKVNNLCEKSQDRFGDSLGIHLIGINGFYEYDKKTDKMIAKKELDTLIDDLIKKSKELNKNIICFILFHNYIAYNPKSETTGLYRTPPCIIYNGDADVNLLKRVIGDFKIIDRTEL